MRMPENVYAHVEKPLFEALFFGLNLPPKLLALDHAKLKNLFFVLHCARLFVTLRFEPKKKGYG